MGHGKAQTAVGGMTVFRRPVPRSGTTALADVRTLHPDGVDVEPRLGRVRDPAAAGGWRSPTRSSPAGSDDEATWLAIMERTVAERPALTREAMAEAGIDIARVSRTPDRPCMESAAA